MAIPDCTTWECVNSFSEWLSAFGTIAAVAVALWLALRDHMLHMRATFNTAVTTLTRTDTLDNHGFMLEFTNIGARPITVTGHEWQLPFQKHRLLFMPHMDVRSAAITTRLPCELTDGKSGHVFYPDDFFLELEDREKALFHPNRLIAYLRIRFFKILIGTSVGKKVHVAIRRPARDALWAQYVESRHDG
ncbi:hypothetical protein LQ772_14855 [Frateuria edaphi]|uniref:hypothetical protein n=1 Tax=Frateuria edaphi TaxID=2898793 RepID=UPI001E4CEECE|nr:hypothetical protein [Frateuria edaphi]UGB45243.1 hypothetical protein LQ772_14855 [Frateuria edaphi]